MKRAYLILATVFLCTSLYSQDAAIPIEAESGTLGSDFAIITEDDVTYVTPSTDFDNTEFPGIPEKVASYEVTFEAAGTYHLYARVRVGSGGANDDSFYAGAGFGAKDPTILEDWVRINNAGASGTAILDAVVTEEGLGGNEIWKWMKLTNCNCAEGDLELVVTEGELVQTYQIGSRENGFDIDMIAFANASLFYTGLNLMNGEVGSPVNNEPEGTDPIAINESKFLGSAYSDAQSFRFDWHWNQVTAENSGKWGSVEGERDQFTWGGLDAAYNHARDNGYIYKHHVLFWGAQQPTWMADLSAAEQLEEIHEWLDALATRYPDLEMLEVVNEPLHDPPANVGANVGTDDYGGYMDALGGSGDTGWDWIIEAFTLARQYFPNAQLMLNDYSILNEASNRTEYLEIIELLKAEDLIDMVGVQGHAFSVNNMNSAGVTNALNDLAEAELPIYVTELDIDGPGIGTAGELTQLNRYREIFPAMWEHASMLGITMWGFNPGHWREDQGATLIRPDGTQKPALQWIRGYVQGTLQDVTSIAVTADSEDVGDESTLQMTAVISPENATFTDVIWSVQDGTGSASINASGLLTGTEPGTVTVVATSIDGSEIFGSTEITVNAVLTTNIEVTADANTVGLGLTLQMTAITTPEEVSTPGVGWSVVDGTGSAQINESGVLRGGSLGTVEVVATATDGTGITGSLEIEIIAILTTSIAVTAPADNVNIGSDLQMSVETEPSDISFPGVAWEVVAGTGTAEITSDGVLTGLTSGNVEVVATATDGSEVSGSLTIMINEPLGLGDEEFSFAISPNPLTQSVVKIEHAQLINSIDVIDINGRKVFSKRHIGQLSYELELGVRPGIYLIRLTDGIGPLTKKLIIK